MIALLFSILASLAIGASVGRYLGYRSGSKDERAVCIRVAEKALEAYPLSLGGRRITRDLGGTVPKRERVTGVADVSAAFWAPTTRHGRYVVVTRAPRSRWVRFRRRLRLAFATFFHGPMCPRCEARHWKIAASVCAANVAVCDADSYAMMLASGRIGGPV